MPPLLTLDALRDQVRHIENPQMTRHGVLPFGVEAIDRALPGGGLALGALHEILGAGGDEEDGAAAAGFTAGILARLTNSLESRISPQPSPRLNGPTEAPRENAAVISLRSLRGREARSEPACPHSPRPNGVGSTLTRNAGEGADGRSPQAGEGAILWCLKRPDVYGPGLAGHGLDPARLVIAAAKRDDDILWAMEEGLRTGRAAGLAGVVGEIGRLPMVAGRRLQLAAESSGVTAFLLRRWRNAAEAAGERGRPTAAVTRWRVAALPSAGIADEPGIGRPLWRLELLRCRAGVPAAWIVESADATGHVCLAAELADRPAMPRRTVADAPVRRAG